MRGLISYPQHLECERILIIYILHNERLLMIPTIHMILVGGSTYRKLGLVISKFRKQYGKGDSSKLIPRIVCP